MTSFLCAYQQLFRSFAMAAGFLQSGTRRQDFMSFWQTYFYSIVKTEENSRCLLGFDLYFNRQGTKADWCGTTQMLKSEQSVNKKNVHRFKCENCGQISVNPELLCEPKKIDLPS